MRKPRSFFAAAFLLALPFAGLAREVQAPAPAPVTDYGPAIARLEAFIARELKDKGLPALSVALVDGSRTIWAKGFGYSDPEKEIPATAATAYRVGSVSKLFTDIGIMQLAERGEIDLDAPIQTILPDFRPKDPFGPSATRRRTTSWGFPCTRKPGPSCSAPPPRRSPARTRSSRPRDTACSFTTPIGPGTS
jgi:CubicO group peptidase (beta-lactamase class C family)